MKSFLTALVLAAIAAISSMPTAAAAQSRVFIITNEPDGYGVDQCLAKSQTCGASAARSFCNTREFTEATAFRRVDPDEITGSASSASTGKCPGPGCPEYVAITCKR